MLLPAHLCAAAAHILKVGSVWMPFAVNTAVLFVHLTTFLMTFPLRLLLSFLFSSHPITILSPPLSTSLHLCLSPLFSHTCSPPHPSHSLALVSSLYFTHIFLHFPRVPGGLADEHHHHRQLHEQVQPSVLVPAPAQAHGVEPP